MGRTLEEHESSCDKCGAIFNTEGNICLMCERIACPECEPDDLFGCGNCNQDVCEDCKIIANDIYFCGKTCAIEKLEKFKESADEGLDETWKHFREQNQILCKRIYNINTALEKLRG